MESGEQPQPLLLCRVEDVGRRKRVGADDVEAGATHRFEVAPDPCVVGKLRPVLAGPEPSVRDAADPERRAVQRKVLALDDDAISLGGAGQVDDIGETPEPGIGPLRVFRRPEGRIG
jgi:hypothetical protein